MRNDGWRNFGSYFLEATEGGAEGGGGKNFRLTSKDIQRVRFAVEGLV